MRGRRPCPPGRGGGVAAVRGEGRFKEVEKTCDKSGLFSPRLGIALAPAEHDLAQSNVDWFELSLADSSRGVLAGSRVRKRSPQPVPGGGGMGVAWNEKARNEPPHGALQAPASEPMNWVNGSRTRPDHAIITRGALRISRHRPPHLPPLPSVSSPPEPLQVRIGPRHSETILPYRTCLAQLSETAVVGFAAPDEQGGPLAPAESSSVPRRASEPVLERYRAILGGAWGPAAGSLQAVRGWWHVWSSDGHADGLTGLRGFGQPPAPAPWMVLPAGETGARLADWMTARRGLSPSPRGGWSPPPPHVLRKRDDPGPRNRTGVASSVSAICALRLKAASWLLPAALIPFLSQHHLAHPLRQGCCGPR